MSGGAANAAVQPDWSLVPAATHYTPPIPDMGINGVYWRLENDLPKEAWAFIESGEVRHYWQPSFDIGLFERLIPRPTPAAAEWDVDGLPPVGAEIECNIRAGRFESCRVVAHVPHKGEQAAVVVYSDGFGWDWATAGDCFRPIRTPEQIAAQEREKAVSAMEEIAAEVWRNATAGGDMIVDICAALYDAGFCKPQAK